MDETKDGYQAALNARIGTLLREYEKSKQETKRIRSGLLDIAVQQLGLEPGSVSQSNLSDFFDGYLVAHGSVQAWRVAAKDGQQETGA